MMSIDERVEQRAIVVGMLREAGLSAEQARAIISAILLLQDTRPPFPGFAVSHFKTKP